jgi:hypothetical protein
MIAEPVERVSDSMMQQVDTAGPSRRGNVIPNRALARASVAVAIMPNTDLRNWPRKSAPSPFPSNTTSSQPAVNLPGSRGPPPRWLTAATAQATVRVTLDYRSFFANLHCEWCRLIWRKTLCPRKLLPYRA